MHVHIPFAEALKAACIDYSTAWGGAFTEKKLIDANASGEHLEVSLVIARPFIEHRMMSAVLAVAGADTGVTLFGPADMQISANTSVKTIEGHYTYAVFANDSRAGTASAPAPLMPPVSPTGATPSRSSRSRRT